MLEVNEKRRKKIVVKNIRGISLDKVTRKARGKREEKIAIKISIKFFFLLWVKSGGKDDAKINGVSLVHSESVLVPQFLLFLTGQVFRSYYCHFQDTTWNWSKAAIKLYFTSQESHSCFLPNSSTFYWSSSMMIKKQQKNEIHKNSKFA